MKKFRATDAIIFTNNKHLSILEKIYNSIESICKKFDEETYQYDGTVTKIQEYQVTVPNVFRDIIISDLKSNFYNVDVLKTPFTDYSILLIKW